MADQFKNFMIGIFITAAAAVIIYILMFLNPRIGNEGRILHVRFTDIDKVTPGTRVTYAGRPVGEVVKIEEVEEGRTGRADSSGHVYIYQLKLRVDTGVDVYNTDKISSRTSGLLGEKNVEITPLAPKKGEKLEIVNDQILYAKETGTVEDALGQLKEASERFNSVMDNINSLLDDIKKKDIVGKVSNTVDNIESITAALNLPKDLSGTVTNIHTLTDKMIKSWDNVDPTIEEFKAFANNAKDVTEKVKNGEGTIGKLITKDDIYLRFNSLMSKLETTMDDINHYGLMFHSDKGWQRLRARRMNLLQTLRTPQEFRNYFDDELDQINTSLSRVYMVLSDVNLDPYCCNMMLNPEFTKVYSELMRRVTQLEEEIRMYNTQIVETTVHETELGPPPLCPAECNPYNCWTN